LVLFCYAKHILVTSMFFTSPLLYNQGLL